MLTMRLASLEGALDQGTLEGMKLALARAALWGLLAGCGGGVGSGTSGNPDASISGSVDGARADGGGAGADAAITYGDPLTADQTFTSADNRVTVTAHAGTRLPVGGLGVIVVRADPLEVRLNPEGAQLNQAVDIVADVGPANAVVDGFADVNLWTISGAQATNLVDKRTAAGREVVSATVSSLGDLMYVKAAPMVALRIDGAAVTKLALATPTLAVSTFRNSTAFVQGTAKRAVKVVSGPIELTADTPATATTFPASSDGASVGVVQCNGQGAATLLYTADSGDWKDRSDLPRQQIEVSRAVACTDLYGELTVHLAGDTTTYSVKLLEASGGAPVDVSGSAGLAYKWELNAACGSLVGDADPTKNAYDHTGCAIEVELGAVLTLTVNVTIADVTPVQRKYTGFARQGEDGGAIVFH
jgi:hypothetical protein